MNLLSIPGFVMFIVAGTCNSAKAQQCSPISSLSCSQVTRSLPVKLNFSGTEGGLVDKSGKGTGFTMVDKPSSPVVTPTNPVFPGYEPAKLEIIADRLNITSTSGLAFKSPSTSPLTNSQVNALGVGINVNSQNLAFQTTLVMPGAGTGKNEQAGLWFGLDEDNYVKLDIISAGSGKSKIEMVKEIAAVSPSTYASTTGLLTLSSSIVKLKLTLTPGTNVITGSYVQDNGAEVTVGSLSIPASFSDGKLLSDGVTGHVSFAGIYTSNRSAVNPVVFSFESFEVASVVPPVADSLIFSPKTLVYSLAKSQVPLNKPATLSSNHGSPVVSFTKTANTRWLVLPNPALGTLSFGVDTTGLLPGTYNSTVTASSNGYVSATLQVTLIWAQQCSPISSLSCSQVTRSLPVKLNFSGTEGGLADKSGKGTGFTMVDKPSSPVVTPTNPGFPGYEPAKLEIIADRLNITSTSGLAFKSPSTSPLTNSQVNALGVGINVNSQNLAFQTTLVMPGAGTGKNEQAGLWFGLDEDNYVKLDIISAGSGKSKIEMVKEIAAVSPSTYASTTGLLTLSSSIVKLKLTLTPGTNVITGSYVQDNGAEVTVGSLSIPASFSDGKLLSDGVTGHVSFAGIYTSNRSAVNPVVFSFESFEVVSVVPPVADSLIFSPGTISYSLTQNATPVNQLAILSSNRGSPAVNLTKTANTNWLILPNPALGTLSFGVDTTGLLPGTYNSTVTASSNGYVSATLQFSFILSPGHSANSILFTQSSQNVEVEQGSSQSLLEYISTSDNIPVNARLTAVDLQDNTPTWLSVNGNIINGINYTTGSEISFNFDATNLSIGTYSAIVKAMAPGYNDAILNISLTVKSGTSGTLSDIKVNFQDSVTVPPTGWLRDFGQSFGPRTSAGQGTGLSYGWIKQSDNSPLDLTKNGRKRPAPSDILLATLVHMQANDLAGFPGTRVEGIWEVQVANGNYDVTVSVGDGSYTDSRHSINVEGVNAIINFIPSANTKFKSSTISVSVADGFLTVDATGGTNTKINSIIIKPTTTRRPSVILVNPENSSQNVSDNASISTSILNLPNGGIDNNTINASSVYLSEELTGTIVPSNVNGTGGGDAITLVPVSPLKLNTSYVFTINDQVKDLSGASFIPYSSLFTTATVSSGEIVNAHFEKIVLPNTAGRHSSLTVGPDGKLYALGIDGLITRFAINNDGTLANPDTLYSLQTEYGSQQPCLAIGFAFDPSATAGNLVAWVTHSSFVFLNGPQWDGKLTRLSGNNLQTVQDVLVNLPRSAKDHVTNSIAFGPDGALYFTQGSTSAMGRADNTWSNRNEPLLSAAVLRLDVSKLGMLPLDVKTPDGAGTYNPYAANAPLIIYASGVRNAYDLVWHTNGNLYTPTNGSAAGGNTPASINGVVRPDGTTYNGPVIPALTNVQQTQKDFLFRIVKGGYYGHPNPLRGEFVMNGGNPTNAIDPAQVDAYPVGTMPDANWRGYSFDFQNNKSPDGAIEYKSNTFNGALKGKLLVVRYSQHDDIITLTPGGPDNDIISSTEGTSIEGFSGFIDPLDLTEDVKTGNIYVSEYGGNGNITLLRPKVAVPAPKSNALLSLENPDKFPANDILAFSKVQTPWSRDGVAFNANHDSVVLRVNNKGINPLIINSLALSNDTTWMIEKLNGVAYTPSALPLTIGSGGFADIKIKFIATNQGTRVKVLHERLTIVSNDDAFPSKIVFLNGLWQSKGEGSNEPYVPEMLDALGFKTAIGFTSVDPDTGNPARPKGDEIIPMYFVRADNSRPVSARQMAGYHGCCYYTESLRWYPKGTTTLTAICSHTTADGQTLLPRRSLPNNPTEGSFNPTTAFGLKIGDVDWTDTTKNPGRKIGVRVWKARDGNNNIIPNAYIIANDYLGTASTNYDYNDNMYYITNVRPETGSAFVSSLSTTPSAVDFGEKILQTTNSLQINLSSLGQIYPDGSSDPAITISAVSIVGDNKSDFSAGMPVTTTLTPQQNTTLTVNFNPLSEGLKIADLLIYYNNLPSPYRVPLYGIGKLSTTTVTANYRINCGSANALTLNGKTWSADNLYSFDNLEPYTNSTVTKIAGTDEDALYLKGQSSNGDKKPFRYEIPIANGNYVVRLHFSEIYWGAPGAGLNGGTGSRVMSVKIENEFSLVNFDVSQEVGGSSALIKNLPVTVTDGKLNIDFAATANRPLVCAIEVYSFSASSARPFITQSLFKDTVISPVIFSMQATEYGLINNFERPKLYPNPLHNRFMIEFPSKYKGICTISISDVPGRTYQIGKTKLNAGGSNMQVDISKLFLKAGIYFLKMQLEGTKTEVIKLVIE